MTENDAMMEQALRDMTAAAREADWERAAFVADRALARGLVHPGFYSTRAIWAEQQDRHEDALNDYLRVLPYAPQRPALLRALGLCLVRLNRAADAHSYLDQALALEPQQAQNHFFKGWAHEALANKDEARQAYRRAIELDPNHAQALGALALMAARNGERADAQAYAERAFALAPADPWAVLAMAMAENAAGKYASAEQRIRVALAAPNVALQARARSYPVLGDALDGQDRTQEAFAAYTAKGTALRQLHAARLAEGPRAIDQLTTLTARLEAMPDAQWAAQRPMTDDSSADDPAAPRQHVFLLGFIRSGTTLLERVLMSDPAVAHVEERDTLADSIPQFFAEPEGLDRLAAIHESQILQGREAYWRRVREYGVEPAGRIVLDKQPLNTLYLPLIQRLFPRAKIVFALRDPRDVLLSVFRRYFEVNATTFEFLDLQDAARFYAATMRWGALCRQKLPLDLHEHRYEDLVADFDSSARAVCDFLGIAWSDRMRDFDAKAQAETIRSPSAAQVRRPLYREGVGQWRRYAQEMAPALPILKPWIERFGYSPD